MGHLTSMTLTFGPPPPYRRQQGDIKVKKGKVFECRQERCDGGYLVNNGRPCLEWVELTTKELDDLKDRQEEKRFWHRRPCYAASGKLNGKRVDFTNLTL